MSLLSTSFHAISFPCRVFFVENQTCVTKSVHLILSLSQGSVAENIHRRTSTCHKFCLLRSLLSNTVISLDAISSRRSFLFFFYFGRYAWEFARAVSASSIPLNLFFTFISILLDPVFLLT